MALAGTLAGPAPARVDGAWFVGAGRTDKGPVRERNEDRFVLDGAGGRLAVVDGMGGTLGGAVAAELACAAVGEAQSPRAALLGARDRLREKARQDEALHGMGAVATVVFVEAGKLRLAHVGDTRAYLAGRIGVAQLTRDHTVVAAEAERATLNEQESAGLGGRNQVTQDLGGAPDGEGWMDLGEVDVEVGDILLLCSDGLHGALTAADLRARLRSARADGLDPATFADALLRAALDAGTRDNVTVVVARLGPPTAPPRNSMGAALGLSGPRGWGALIAAAALGFAAGRVRDTTTEGADHEDGPLVPDKGSRDSEATAGSTPSSAVLEPTPADGQGGLLLKAVAPGGHLPDPPAQAAHPEPTAPPAPTEGGAP